MDEWRYSSSTLTLDGKLLRHTCVDQVLPMPPRANASGECADSATVMNKLGNVNKSGMFAHTSAT